MARGALSGDVWMLSWDGVPAASQLYRAGLGISALVSDGMLTIA